jgi:hypothetical protein
MTDTPEPVRPSTPVADKLLLLFGWIAGILLVLSVVLVGVLTLFRPEADISGLLKMLDTQISIILGAVLGWAARSSATPRS